MAKRVLLTVTIAKGDRMTVVVYSLEVVIRWKWKPAQVPTAPSYMASFASFTHPSA